MKKIIIVLMLFTSCSQVAKLSKNNRLLIGTWCLTTNEINYPTLSFLDNSMAILGSKIDTVYSHRYYLKGKRLFFILPDSQVNENRIIKLTCDSLVLETLLENKNRQTYYKCDNKK